ncbi:MAG TPA: murein biosynthesis integral membrane protein MurJ [Vicinamibacterales bacterium]|nr:murein biosynthesis integral membrane protein MurJ [Vicinamibacterales bacterium]
MADSDSSAEARKSEGGLVPPKPQGEGGHPRLARSAGVFGLATITSRILGLVREQVMAYYFGAGNEADAFRVASRLPNLVRDLFAEGAMSAAFIPTFTRQLTLHGRERSWRLANSVINALLIATGVIVVLGIVFAGPLVRLYAPDFSEVPGKIELTIYLARIVFPFLTMVAVAAVLMGMLNSLGHFFVPALSPAMFNVAGIVMALTLIPFAPAIGVRPITIIAIGTLVGGLGQLAIQWPPLHKEGFHYQPVLDVKDEGLRRALLLMGPGTLGMAATQINVFVNTQLATGQGTGAVSWLDYSFRLMYLPIGLFGVSIATAATPAISRMVAEQDFPRIRSTLANALGLMFFLNLPATIGLIVLARPIVSVIFERGHFTAADTLATAAALQLYAIGLLGYSVVRIISPTFYALGRSRVPVIVSAVSVIVNVALNLTLVRFYGYRGLALGTSITAIINATIQLFLLRRELHGIDGSRIAASFARVSIASAFMGAMTWGASRITADWMPGTSLSMQMVRLLITITISLMTLTAAAQVLRIQEYSEARDLVLRRLKRMVG